MLAKPLERRSVDEAPAGHDTEDGRWKPGTRRERSADPDDLANDREGFGAFCGAPLIASMNALSGANS
jgi:hypothetical protein